MRTHHRGTLGTHFWGSFMTHVRGPRAPEDPRLRVSINWKGWPFIFTTLRNRWKYISYLYIIITLPYNFTGAKKIHIFYFIHMKDRGLFQVLTTSANICKKILLHERKILQYLQKFKWLELYQSHFERP